jgi:hypothetical protein
VARNPRKGEGFESVSASRVPDTVSYSDQINGARPELADLKDFVFSNTRIPGAQDVDIRFSATETENRAAENPGWYFPETTGIVWRRKGQPGRLTAPERDPFTHVDFCSDTVRSWSVSPRTRRLASGYRISIFTARARISNGRIFRRSPDGAV